MAPTVLRVASPALPVVALGIALAVTGGAVARADSTRPGASSRATEADEGEAAQPLRVTTARQFLEALGPDRVIELAPGTYDLSALTEVTGPYLSWEEAYDGSAPVIHDLRGLTLRGPREGEARIELVPRYAHVLTFRRVRDVTLEDLVLGHVNLPETCGAGVLRIDESADVTVRRTVLFGSGTEGLTLVAVRNSHFEEVTVRATTYHWMTLRGSDGVTFERCRWIGVPDPGSDSRPLRVFDSWGVEVLEGELVDRQAHPEPWLGSYLEVDTRSAVRFRETAAVDEVTGRRWPLEGVVPPGAADLLPESLYRTPEWELLRGAPDGPPEWRTRPATLRLHDGRSLPLTVEDMSPGVLDGGLDPTSVRVRRLGPDGPLLVRWRERPSGMGHYATGYYRVLGPASEDPVLLAGEISLSGGAGAGNFSSGSFEFGYEDGVVTLREERSTHSLEDKPLPLHYPEAFGDQRLFQAQIETVEIRRWKLRGAGAEPAAHTLYYRIQEGDTLEAVVEGLWMTDGLQIRREWLDVPPEGTLPEPGKWLRIDRPVGSEPAGVRTDGPRR